MAKNKLELSTPSVEPSAKNEAKNDTKGKTTKKANAKNRKPIGRYFKDIISELKKVDWAKFTSTKNNKGVLAQTGIVLVIVLIFIVLITAMDLGLTKLLELLIGVAA